MVNDGPGSCALSGLVILQAIMGERKKEDSL